MPRAQMITATLALGLALATTAHAADKDAPLKQLHLSQDIARFGRDNHDALALIVAAKLRLGIAEKPVDRAPDQTPAAQDQNSDSTSVKSLVTEALQISNNDPAIKAFADDLSASATKGRVQGVAVSTATLAAGGLDKYSSLKFAGGKYAEVDIEAINGGGLGLFIYDANDNLICRDVSGSVSAYCGWIPAETAAFTIKVESHSKVPLRYKFSTN